MEMLNLITLEEARERIRETFPVFFGKERVDLIDAFGRVLGEDLFFPEDLPPFNRAIMDGYAVRAKDTFLASEEEPVHLKVIEEVQIGKEARRNLLSGEAQLIATGSMLPPGADAVVMKEYTSLAVDREVEIRRPVAPGESIVRAGDEGREGQELLKEGHVLWAPEIGALAALGITNLQVYAKPKVGIISTGDELVSLKRKPVAGEIRDINSYSLWAAILDTFSAPVQIGIVEDDYSKMKEALEKSLSLVDILLISGGSSVGTRDITVPLLQDLSFCGLLFHGIAVKPGKPTICAAIEGKPVFGLPGHPVSVLVTFYALVRPLLFQALKIKEPPRIKAIMTRSIFSSSQREEFIPVFLEDKEGLKATPILGKSSLITILLGTSGLIQIPLDVEGVEEGEEVEVLPFR